MNDRVNGINTDDGGGTPSHEVKPKGEQIRELLDQGYTSQEIEEMGFNPTTIAKEVKKRKTAPFPKLPQKLASKDMIPPEVALQGIRLEDGRYKEGFVDGMSVLIMAARYNQLLASSQAEALKGQIEIFKLAQGGTEQAIEQLAGEFAGAVHHSNESIIQAIQQQKIASSPNPMQEVVVQTLQPYLQQALGNALSGLMKGAQHQGQPPREAPYQGQSPPQEAPHQGQSPLQGIPIEKHSLTELEEEE